MLYDVFICHASEDKDEFVRPLAERLRQCHIEVWYDEFSLKVGDSIRRAIDLGLSKSRFGIVILSRNFFAKEWPQWELDGLVQRQNTLKTNIILPIWYDVVKEEVLAFSPPLADKMAIIADRGLEQVVLQLSEVLKPEGSTLMIARDHLLEFGYEPPVVSDDWWLDVIEYSGSNDMEGTFQEAMGWGRWGFPLPPKGEKPSERGKRLALAALQMRWQEAAEGRGISQITHPIEVLRFIESQPGLTPVCHEYLPYLAAYAPQITIKGLGGEFEEDFEAWYRHSLDEQRRKRNVHNISGTGLTRNKLPPACDEPVSLRHPQFGNYEPQFITGWFVQGELNGPPVKVYDTIDYLVWFLSDQSHWMPRRVRKFLLEGFKHWSAWVWFGDISENGSYKFLPNNSTGSLFSAMFDAKTFTKFRLTDDCLTDIRTRFDHTVKSLKLSETADNLAQRFIEAGFIEAWINAQKSENR